jgi:DNA-binding response OmpR family regulator
MIKILILEKNRELAEECRDDAEARPNSHAFIANKISEARDILAHQPDIDVLLIGDPHGADPKQVVAFACEVRERSSIYMVSSTGDRRTRKRLASAGCNLNPDDRFVKRTGMARMFFNVLLALECLTA